MKITRVLCGYVHIKMKDPINSLEIIDATKPVDMGLRAFSLKIPTVVTSIEPNSKEMASFIAFCLVSCMSSVE